MMAADSFNGGIIYRIVFVLPLQLKKYKKNCTGIGIVMFEFPNGKQRFPKILAITLLSSILCSVQAADTVEGRIEVASSFNPVGSGARALGMGGAFISIADDATAASWNPGALIQLRTPEISIVGGGFGRQEDNTFGNNPEASGIETVTNTSLNYLSASYPCGSGICGKNMVFSINYQNLYNFSKDWAFPIDALGDNFKFNTNYDFVQSGDLYALGLAYAIQATDELSLGFTLNFWGDYLKSNEWKQRYKITDTSFYQFGSSSLTTVEERLRKDTYQFSGFNANLGVFWEFYQKEETKLTLGLVLKTPFTADIKHTGSLEHTVSDNGSPPIYSRFPDIDVDEKIDMPMSYGLGLAYQVSDALTLAGDIYRTNWDDFIRTDANGNKFSVISNVPESESKVKPTYQVRLGMEYRIISQEFGNNYIIPLRAGVFYDPAPAEGAPDDLYGFSVGGGIAYETYVFDIAYQYRFGNDVGKYVLPTEDFSQDIREHTLYASLAVRF